MTETTAKENSEDGVASSRRRRRGAIDAGVAPVTLPEPPFVDSISNSVSSASSARQTRQQHVDPHLKTITDQEPRSGRITHLL